MKSRLRFYFDQQDGRCYLRITPFCIGVGGVMTFLNRDERRARNGVHRKDDATWDHIFPKPRSQDDEPFQLLACSACNNVRGQTPARAEHIALAMRLLDEYKVLQGEPSAKALRRAERRANRRKVRELQIGEQGDAKKRRHARHHPMPAVEQPTPRTVAEAIAQGGLIARPKRGWEPRGWSHADEEKLAARIRAERNAESQASALRGIAARARDKGDKPAADALTDRARDILNTVRGGR